MDEQPSGTISISDPAWATTFPHIIFPLENEWIVGVLLRCDLANLWESGGTLAYVLGPGHRARRMQGVELLTEIHFKKLGRALDLPLKKIAATTYQPELLRLYRRGGVSLLSASAPPFHLCPTCIAEASFLPRILALPGLTLCLQHQTQLATHCQCGVKLQPFHSQAAPFSCPKCAWEWSKLPVFPADPAQIEREQKLLEAFSTFFAIGSPNFLAQAFQIICARQEKTASLLSQDPTAYPLEFFVGSCLKLGISLSETPM